MLGKKAPAPIIEEDVPLDMGTIMAITGVTLAVCLAVRYFPKGAPDSVALLLCFLNPALHSKEGVGLDEFHFLTCLHINLDY